MANKLIQCSLIEICSLLKLDIQSVHAVNVRIFNNKN